jgi:sRNA-binding regulator protein Hfq
MEASNRRLIRPSLTELKEKIEAKRNHAPVRDMPPVKKPAGPPEQTNAENFYYAKQVQMKTPMVVVLRDGEQVLGSMDWYDKHCIRMLGEDGRKMVIYKSSIKYMYKNE